VQQGLVGLGWSAKDADQAIEAVADQVSTSSTTDGSPDVAALLRAALRALSKA
jgi:holliday junction DNA helicase RuvA